MAKRLILAALALAVPHVANAEILGSDAAACHSGGGPAILAQITGLKDRTGSLKLELYPPNENDFLKDDRDLIAQGKLFRRVRAPLPPAGSVSICIRVPRPGTYAVLFTHDRDGKNKFNVWEDGAGVPSNRKLGRAKPQVSQAMVTVGPGMTTVPITVQYLHGIIPSFGPLKG